MTAVGGRPLRFFGLAMLGWVTIRVSGSFLPALLPATNSSPAPPFGPKPSVSSKTSSIMALGFPAPASGAPSILHPPRHARSRAWTGFDRNNDTPVKLMQFITEATDFADNHPTANTDQMTSFAAPRPLPNGAPRTDQWRASAWLLWRPGNNAASGPIAGSRLGGSQAGVRVDYELTPRARTRTAAYGRLSSALERPAAPEAAIGIAFQPIRAIPFSLAAERRIALGQGGRNANTVMAVGGFGPTMIVTGVEVEGYAQAGMVGFHRRDGFIDGKLSVLTPLPHTPIRVGAALSGGAQPGASRLDIGPEMQIRLPLPRMTPRLIIEWRERIGGDAQPDSGLAVTLASDF
ncbi:hypothetical protein SAMN05518849_13324 [Sphingobium sp. AP50]|uniref:hypothetical protein n=1 Tax=Sphingobium sp. AP50 TaxID=1884369 RepID=UPI0008C4FA79|nr:hypothetical protein [Sphingobium sp. AP50]SEK04511.1 hypothetical protein SAMN05518849_13324 [Sphingobium sp. AP50]